MGNYSSKRPPPPSPPPTPPPPPPTRYQEPWRKGIDFTEDEKRRLWSLATNYSPFLESRSKIKFYNILLVGKTGAGKSSWCTTLNSALLQKVTFRSPAGVDARSKTQKYSVRKFYPESDKPLKFRVCDTIGLQRDAVITDDSFYPVLEGRVCLGAKFEFGNKPTGLSDSNCHKQVQVVCLVIDGSTLKTLPGEYIMNFKQVIKLSHLRDIPVVVLLTNTDKVMGDVPLEDIFYRINVHELVKQASEILEIQQNCIWPVKNYTKEAETERCVDILALSVLQVMLRMVDDCLANQADMVEDSEETGVNSAHAAGVI